MGSGTPQLQARPASISVLREVVRRWPVVLVVTLAAVAAGLLALSRREDSYTATARLAITPLAQNDETFLGTGLVRDAGDAARTPATVAERIDSRAVATETARRVGGGASADSVRGDVDVEPVPDTNVVEVKARADEPDRAVGLANAFARSTLRVRWRSIAPQLDRRIAALDARRAADPDGAELARERAILAAVRRSGTDPTLTLEETRPARSADALPAAAVILLALVGGLLLGALAAVGMARFGQRVRSEDDAVAVYPLPVLARVRPGPALREGFGSVAVQIERAASQGGTVVVASPANGDGSTMATGGLAAAIGEGGYTTNVVRLDHDDTGRAVPTVHDLIAEARTHADFVIIDAPSLANDARSLRAATLADVVVLVVRLGHTARQELGRVRDLLEPTGVRPAGFLVIEATVEPVGGGSPPGGRIEEQPPAPDVLPVRR